MIMVKHLLRAIIGKLSACVVILSLCFVLYRLWINREQFIEIHLDIVGYLFLAMGVLVYASANLLLAKSWELLLNWCGQKNTETVVCRSIYARSQIAKYVPGNIVQIAGRHLEGLGVGYTNRSLLLSAIHEIALLIIASFFVVSLFSMVKHVYFNLVQSIIILTVTVIVYMVVVYIVNKYKSNWYIQDKYSETSSTWHALSCISYILCHYMLFFVIAGVVLWLTQIAICKVVRPDLIANAIIVFSVSWLAGFVAFGAPSGVGIREGIIVLNFSGSLGEANSLAIAILYRIITVTGDILFWWRCTSKK